MPMSEAAFSANFRLVLANCNLPVNLTLRGDETTTSDEFVAKLNELIHFMLSGGWNAREASLGPNQDIQEASAYIVGRSSNGARIVHLFKPPLEKRTGYVYEEMLDKLPFKLTGKETAYPVPGVNPQLPRDEQYLIRLPGTFQFIRTAQPAKDGGMAAKRYTAVYFVPASMQLELQTEEQQQPPTGDAGDSHPDADNIETEVIYPHGNQALATAQQLAELKQLFVNLFGPADADEAARYIVHKYTTALHQHDSQTPAHADPARLTSAQLTYVFQTVGNNAGRYQEQWNAMKLGWLSRKQANTA
ncbi:MAG: hypothetical protein R6W76_21725 [Caldilinea sp.]